MATARELLEQADALMRRNRSRDADGEDAGSGIPLLTEVVGPVPRTTARSPRARDSGKLRTARWGSDGRRCRRRDGTPATIPPPATSTISRC